MAQNPFDSITAQRPDSTGLQSDRSNYSFERATGDSPNGINPSAAQESSWHQQLWGGDASNQTGNLRRVTDSIYGPGAPEVTKARPERNEAIEKAVKKPSDFIRDQLNLVMPAELKFQELARLFSNDCRLSQVFLPGDEQGTVRTTYSASDGSCKLQIRRPDGSQEEHFKDRYGRPLLTRVEKGGKWIITETRYHDSAMRISPFRAVQRTTSSEGSINEVRFTCKGRKIGFI